MNTSVDSAINALQQMISIDGKHMNQLGTLLQMETGEEILEALSGEDKVNYTTIFGILKKTHEMAFMAGKMVGLAKM
ncbi:MAG: hypothetical protein WCG55_03110 [bacterium]